MMLENNSEIKEFKISDMVLKEVEEERVEVQRYIDSVVDLVKKLYIENNAEASRKKKNAGDGKSIAPARYALISDRYQELKILDKKYREISLTNLVDTKPIISGLRELSEPDYNSFISKMKDEGLVAFKISISDDRPRVFSKENADKGYVLFVPEPLIEVVKLELGLE